MSYLLLIETSSINCSVAICNNEQIVALVEQQELNIHASAITLFIEQALKEANLTIHQCF